MNLQDALGDWSGGNQNQSGGSQWPGQSSPAWPSQPSNNPEWPGMPSQPSGFPGAPTNPMWNSGPSQPAFPGAPLQPSNPGFPTFPGGSFQPSQPSGPGFPGGPLQPSHPTGPGFPAAQTNLMMPFKQEINGGLQDKKLITIRGKVKPNAERFAIDLCTRSDLAFHFNPRFNEDGRQVIVRNTRTRDKWGKEERESPSFPFKRGENFEIKILATPTGFKVAVNDHHLVDYNHRLNMRDVCGISINGDCMLTGYNVETMH